MKFLVAWYGAKLMSSFGTLRQIKRDSLHIGRPDTTLLRTSFSISCNSRAEMILGSSSIGFADVALYMILYLVRVTALDR